MNPFIFIEHTFKFIPEFKSFYEVEWGIDIDDEYNVFRVFTLFVTTLIEEGKVSSNLFERSCTIIEEMALSGDERILNILDLQVFESLFDRGPNKYLKPVLGCVSKKARKKLYEIYLNYKLKFPGWLEWKRFYDSLPKELKGIEK